MKKILAYCLFALLIPLTQAEESDLDKKHREIVEKYMIHNRSSDGDFSTISLRNWKAETNIPFLTSEDMIRKVLAAFANHYKNLNILSFSIIYSNKGGVNAGIELDFILIHHETKPTKTYRFGTNKEKE